MRLLNVSTTRGVRVRVGVCCAVAALFVSACVGEAEKVPMSEAQLGWDSGQSQVESPDDVVAMSGIYEVTREGKLLPYSSAPRVKKPELDDVAKVHDNNGAEAFAQYFIKVVEYTWDSGDSSLLREISLPSCEWCEYVASSTEERAANKGWVRNLKARVLEVKPAFEIPDHPGLWHVETVVETSAHQEYSGSELREIAEARTLLSIQMRYDEGAWKISATKGEDMPE